MIGFCNFYLHEYYQIYLKAKISVVHPYLNIGKITKNQTSNILSRNKNKSITNKHFSKYNPKLNYFFFV